MSHAGICAPSWGTNGTVSATQYVMKRLACVLLCLIASMAFLPAIADAHEGKAIINVESSEETGELERTYRVRIVWDNDLHAAKDATVTATGVSPNGSATTPVVLSAVDADGRYEGTLTYPSPGAWTVRFTVVTPPGTLEQPEMLTTTTTSAPPPTTSAPPTGEVAAPATTTVTSTAVSEPETEPLPSNTVAGTVILIVSVVTVLVGFAVVLRRGKRNT